jgi:filamentous hemagglutinin family protein
MSGSAVFQQVDDKNLHITASDRAIIHWNEFSIQAGEATKFIQPHAQAAVLNRVIGGSVSHLMGTLEANGRVYLINPTGVIIGKDSVINTASFLASTLDVLDGQFLANKELTFKGDSKSFLINYGKITAWDGDVILMSYQIDNQGDIQAPNGTVALGAGQEILLKPEGERMFVHLKAASEKEGVGIDHSGRIEALRAELKADGNPYAMAINHRGETDAVSVANINGEVFLMAEEGAVSVLGAITAESGDVRLLGDQVILRDEAKIDVSGENGGGAVLVGGDYQGKNPDILNASLSFIDSGVTIRADALDNGTGGKVIVWGEVGTAFHGEISARGGPNGGDGGFVELSSKGRLEVDPNGAVTTIAPLGKTGTLLFDPCVVTIGGADAGFVFFVPAAPCSTVATMGADFTGFAAATISTATLTGAMGLGTNNVCINASATGTAGVGSITVASGSPFTWATTNTLTLRATDVGSFVSIEDAVNASSAGFTAGTPAIAIISPTVNIGNSGHALGNSSTLTCASGVISIDAASALNLYGGAMGFVGEIAPTGTGTVMITGGGAVLLEPSVTTGSTAQITAPSTIDIGTLATPMGTMTLGTALAQSDAQISTTSAGGNITVHCGNVDLIGGTGAGTASAIIGSSGTTTNISFNPMGAGGVFTLAGGSATGSGNAQIISAGGTIALRGTNFNLTGGSAAAPNQAAIDITGDGTISVTATGMTGIELRGGTASGGSDAALDTAALIRTSGTGADNDITIGTTNLLVKGGAVGAGLSYAEARIQTARGGIAITASGDITVGDDTMLPTPTCSSYIETATAVMGGSNNITISCQNLTCRSVVPSLINMFEAGGYAQVYCRDSGAISLDISGNASFIGGSSDVTGGNFPASHAGIVIQNGGTVSTGIPIGGNLLIDATLGSAGIVSGSVINNSPPSPAPTPATNYDLTITGDCTLTAGAGGAVLGNRDNGNIILNVTGDIQLQGGSSVTAMVPSHGIATFVTAVGTGTTGNIDVTARSFTINGGTAANPNAGAYNTAGIGTGQVLGGASGDGTVTVHATGFPMMGSPGITVQGGTAADCYAYIGSFGSASTSIVTVTSDAAGISLLGGTGDRTAASILSNFAGVTVTATVGDCILTADQGSARIGNIFGGGDVQVIVTSGEVNIQGGASALAVPNNAFAAIFGALTPTGMPGTSNVSVTARNVSIKGGTLATLSKLNFGGIFTGNFFGMPASTGIGTITIHATGAPLMAGPALLIQGGTTDFCSAFIETFTHDPACTISITTDVAGISALAGSALQTQAHIATFNADIQVNGVGDCTLQGDRSAATIGTVGGGDVTVHMTGDILIQGGSNTMDAFPLGGFAGIASSVLSGTGSVDVLGNSIALIGGSGSTAPATNFAVIATGSYLTLPAPPLRGGDGTVTVHATGSPLLGGSGITIRGGTAMNCPAVIGTFGSMSGNNVSVTSDISGITIEGTATDFCEASIQTLTDMSTISLTVSGSGTTTLQAGAGNTSSASVFTPGSGSSITATFGSGPVTLNASSGMNSWAKFITNGTSSPITFTAGASSLTFTGGSGANAIASIQTTAGSSFISIPSAGAVTLDGGSYTSMGPGDGGATISSSGIDSPISMTCGPLTIKGGTVVASLANIWTSGDNSPITLGVTGNIDILSNLGFLVEIATDGVPPASGDAIHIVGTGNVNLLASSGAATIRTNAGNIFCSIGGDYTIQGGSMNFSPAGIACNGNGNVTLIGSNYTLNGGSSNVMFPSVAVIGVAVFSMGSGNVNITSTGSTGIILNGGSLAMCDALITSGQGISDAVTFSTAGDLILTSNVAGAMIRTFGGSIIDPVGNDIILAGTMMSPATISIPGGGAGSILLIAGRNMSLNPFSSITNASTGGITLVTDNDNPFPPEIGDNSFFITEAGSSIDASIGGGPLRIYAARQQQVTIDGTLNGLPFVKGPLYVNTLQEHWQVYYPNIFINGNFNAVLATNLTAPYLEQFIPATFEALDDWKVGFGYNDLVFSPATVVKFNRSGYRKQKGVLNSFEVLNDKSYGIAREQYKNYRTLKLDQL